MIDRSLAQAAHPVPEDAGDLEHIGSIIPRALNPRLLSPRLARGIALAQERFDEIIRIAPWIWSVPSCSRDHHYTVDLKAGTCSCPDRVPAANTNTPPAT